MLRSWFSLSPSESTIDNSNDSNYKPLKLTQPLTMTQADPKGYGFHTELHLRIMSLRSQISKEAVLSILQKWAAGYTGPPLLEPMVKILVAGSSYNLENLSKEADSSDWAIGVDDTITWFFKKEAKVPMKYLTYSTSIRDTWKGIDIILDIKFSLTRSVSPGKLIGGFLSEDEMMNPLPLPLREWVTQLCPEVDSSDFPNVVIQ